MSLYKEDSEVHMSLIHKLTQLHNNQALSMHVPGHKNNTIGNLEKIISAEYDLTEIPGLDDLHDPADILQELNAMLSMKSEGYNAQAMVNGTTNGIISSIYALNEVVSHFYIIGDAHKSIFHGLSLVNASYDSISLDDLEDVSLKNTCVIFTSPTYAGEIINNIDEHVEYIRVSEGFTLIDAAHGAHLSITKNFNKSLLLSKADVVVESYHKMLPALTMASVLFTREDRLHQRIMFYIDHFETSSPSYLVLASIEYAQYFYNTYDDTEFFKKRSTLIKHLESLNIDVKEQDDPAKIILSFTHGSYELERRLRAQNIYSEMVTDEGVLWCLPLWHDKDSYPFDDLLKRLSSLTKQNINEGKSEDLSILLDKICVKNIVPYPPGVPLVLKGNRISARYLKTIKHYRVNHVKIEGIEYNINYYMNEAGL